MAFRLFVCVSLAIVATALAQPASAQDAPAQPPPVPTETQADVDPSSPMTELPEIGVDWPDLAAPDPVIDGQPAAPPVAADTVEGERRYEVKLEGFTAPTEEFETRFKLLSTLRAGDGKPANIAQIDRRARDDVVLLRELMRSEGYYDAEIDQRIEPAPTGDRLIVTLEIVPGPVYRFADVDVKGLESAGAKAVELKNAFPVDTRDVVNADDVIAAETNLKTVIGREGFPFAKVGEPEVVVDHDTRTATLAMTVDPGGERRIGAIIVKGDKPPFGAKHVGRIARFKPGELYAADKIDDLRRALVATGIVSTAKVEPVPAVDPKLADIVVTLEPAPLRTLAAEAGYGTGEGFRVEASWTHRNFIRPEGAVTFRGIAGTREQMVSAVLRQNNWRKRDQILNARAIVSNQTLDAFEARTFEIGAGIERQTNIIWQKKWTWSAGLELVATNERDVAQISAPRQTYFIGALPATLNYDGSNDLLDPTEGFRLGLRFSPEASLQNGSNFYARAQVDASGYFPVGKTVVLAGRVRAATISGAPLVNIAPSRRLYSGGGGSVRGYGYQEIGPRDAFNDPVGGRSLVEFALEARVKLPLFGGGFSVVPFLDAGNVYTESVPKLSGLQYGAGLGLRYNTGFGPIRIDVGTPINRRAGDARVAVYVSLGQAF